MKTQLPKLTIADLSRAGHVTRWHSVRTSRDQTLAEHHFLVMRISNQLAKEIIGPELSDSDLLRIMEYSSQHDMPELLMGDLPSPVKRHIEAITGKDNPINRIEEEVAPWLSQLKTELKQEHRYIIKLADLIDALVFISEEGIGNHAKKVIQLLHEMLEEKLKECTKQFPQYNWPYTVELLNELLQNDETTKIEFESI